jgi:hypothetical protein
VQFSGNISKWFWERKSMKIAKSIRKTNEKGLSRPEIKTVYEANDERERKREKHRHIII